jgi:uncharacterized glyoxalase superfamily protein PhnB
MNNRSMPPGVFIPELAYPDVLAAAEWLCRWFGFSERLRIGDHRVQLTLGEGSIVVVREWGSSAAATSREERHAVMVRVADVDAHYERARSSGARIFMPPTDFPYGERQYSLEDPSGHAWIFSQSIEDVDPASWGGQLLGETDGRSV